MSFFTLVAKNLLRRRLRTTLTCLGIGVAVMAVVALVGIASGFERGFVEVFEGRGVDLIVVEGGITEQLTSSLDQKLVDKVSQLPGVQNVAAMLLEVLAFEKENLVGVMVQGWAIDSFLFRDLKMSHGRSLKTDDRQSAVLGSILARNLNKQVGDTIEIDREDFTIVGIFDSFNVFENGSVVVPLSELQRVMVRPNQVTAMAVVLEGGPNKKDALAHLCRTIEGFTDERGKRLRLTALPTKDYVASTLQIRMAQGMAFITSAIALIIGAIGMMNTMMTSVLERTKEIGILRAMGWRRHRVVRMVLGEAVLQGLVGATLGCLAAIGVVHALSKAPSVGGFIQGDMSAIVLLMGYGVALFVGLAGGLYPAWCASKLAPAEALRHD